MPDDGGVIKLIVEEESTGSWRWGEHEQRWWYNELCMHVLVTNWNFKLNAMSLTMENSKVLKNYIKCNVWEWAWKERGKG